MQNNTINPVLTAENLGIDFGGLTAVDKVDIKIYPKQIRGLIGPNGAGKTTLFNLLTGVYKPTRGEITINGNSTKGKTCAAVSRMGAARTFQNIRLFSAMSVIDNVKIGMHPQIKTNLFSSVSHLFGYSNAEKQAQEKALELLEFFDMADMKNYIAGSLSYGAQRRLEIVRALATNPSVLLLDEPAAGMNPSETAQLMESIRRVRDNFDVAILLIEHDMNLVMGVCEEITVLNYGKVIAQGTPEQIKQNPQVIQAYLGAQAVEVC